MTCFRFSGNNVERNLEYLEERLREAVAHYWRTRENQSDRQVNSGRSDHGARSAVTGGAQMDGFIKLFAELAKNTGVSSEHIFFKRSLELPGFFRPTKEWDFLIVRNGQLLIALEAKSQVGPSFGNNFNNRTEEAMGSALDLWTAYREGALNKSHQPWLGYMFLLEDCDASRRPVRTKEPHFPIFPEFKRSSYARRYELFCRKLVRERHYNAASFLLSDRGNGIRGLYQEPADDLSFEMFCRSLTAHLKII